jgi:hypothetical protein
MRNGQSLKENVLAKASLRRLVASPESLCQSHLEERKTVPLTNEFIVGFG